MRDAPFEYQAAIVLDDEQLMLVGAFLVFGFVLLGVIRGAQFLRDARQNRLARSAALAAPAPPSSSRRQEPIRASRPADGKLVDAVHEAAEANVRSIDGYRFSDAEIVAIGTNWVGVTFESEGVEWTLAHMETKDFELIERAANILRLRDFAKLVAEAEAMRPFTTDPKWHDVPIDDPAWKSVVARCDAIEERFRKAGGLDRFVSEAKAYLEKHYILAPQSK